MGLPGPHLNTGLRDLIRAVQPGGFIFFNRNLASPSQFFDLVCELNSLCNTPPIFTIDQEGGRVARLSRFAPKSVSAWQLAQTGVKSIDLSRRHGELTGRLLRTFGLNLNLAPVVDFWTEYATANSLRDRCFGATPEDVILRAGAFLLGMQAQGVLGTIKHFPGYTYAEVDPHGELPKVHRSFGEMEREELAIFQALATQAAAIMIGHGYFPSLQAHEPAQLPASLSPSVIQKLLRKSMGYSGLVMSDDLEMGAIAETYGMARTAELAIEAGEDMLLICHNPACVQIAHDQLVSMPEAKLVHALESVASFKKKLPPMPDLFNSTAFEEVCREIESLRVQVEKTSSS